jgi:hypothetical protein
LIAFEVSEEAPNAARMPSLDRDAALRAMLRKQVEALPQGSARSFVRCTDANAFVQAAHAGFLWSRRHQDHQHEGNLSRRVREHRPQPVFRRMGGRCVGGGTADGAQ